MDSMVIPTTDVCTRSSCSSNKRQLGVEAEELRIAIMKKSYKVILSQRMKDGGVTIGTKEPRSNMIQS